MEMAVRTCRSATCNCEKRNFPDFDRFLSRSPPRFVADFGWDLGVPTVPAQAGVGNYYLLGLSASEFGLLRLHLTSFDLRVGDRLHDVGGEVDQVVFPHSGLVSMTLSLPDGGEAAVSFVGRDGIVGGF